MLCDPFTGIGIAYLEANSRRWDDLPGFRVFFDDLNEGLKGGVVDEIPIPRRLRSHTHQRQASAPCLPSPWFVLP